VPPNLELQLPLPRRRAVFGNEKRALPASLLLNGKCAQSAVKPALYRLLIERRGWRCG
jgi:hypothetical protein